jgi:hypothetical protein
MGRKAMGRKGTVTIVQKIPKESSKQVFGQKLRCNLSDTLICEGVFRFKADYSVYVY